MLRVALVGVGDAGTHHARALKTLAAEGALSFGAVCARDAARLQAFRSAHAIEGGVATFESLEALLDARACDAVILATPDGVHAEQAVKVVEAGMHVLVEKPLALTLAEGARAAAAARSAGRYLAVGYHLRHHAAHRVIAARKAELVGEVRSIFVRWAWPDPAVDGWRARGDGAKLWSLAALGTHGIDLAMWLTGAVPTDAAGDVVGLTEPARGIDRAAEVSLRVGTALAHVSVSVVHRAVSRVSITGDAGELEAVGTLGARGDGELFWRAPRKPPVPIAFEPENPYAAQLRDFVGRAERGFASDAALLANIDVLDRINGQRQGSS